MFLGDMSPLHRAQTGMRWGPVSHLRRSILSSKFTQRLRAGLPSGHTYGARNFCGDGPSCLVPVGPARSAATDLPVVLLLVNRRRAWRGLRSALVKFA